MSRSGITATVGEVHVNRECTIGQAAHIYCHLLGACSNSSRTCDRCCIAIARATDGIIDRSADLCIAHSKACGSRLSCIDEGIIPGYSIAYRRAGILCFASGGSGTCIACDICERNRECYSAISEAGEVIAGTTIIKCFRGSSDSFRPGYRSASTVTGKGIIERSSYFQSGAIELYDRFINHIDLRFTEQVDRYSIARRCGTVIDRAVLCRYRIAVASIIDSHTSSYVYGDRAVSGRSNICGIGIASASEVAGSAIAYGDVTQSKACNTFAKGDRDRERTAIGRIGCAGSDACGRSRSVIDS